MAADKRQTAANFNRLKQHDGGAYSGMKVGGSHKWYYDRGEWRERKLSPDEWSIYYQTTKRRAGKAPEGSGAPTGTQYNWLIVSHQRVDKLDANSYMTCMEGRKFKVAHKRASKETWNTSEKAQRERVIHYLEQLISELRQADAQEQVPFTVGEKDRIYGLEHRNREELYALATQMGIAGRSRMSRAELLEVVQGCHQEQTGKPQARMDKPAAPAADKTADLQNKTRNDLYRLAGERKISGRSDMNKADLLRALQRDLGKPAGDARQPLSI